jgi:predicted nuclease of restriction endonuclease-like (RecB) superfamily
LSVDSGEARIYYEREALRGGWTFRMLDRQIATNSFERLKGKPSNAQGLIPNEHPDEYIRDPFVLEFLNLHDDYSELDLESALIRELESFLLELGNDFAFVARQKRLRVGTEWYKVDLVFFRGPVSAARRKADRVSLGAPESACFSAIPQQSLSIEHATIQPEVLG